MNIRRVGSSLNRSGIALALIGLAASGVEGSVEPANAQGSGDGNSWTEMNEESADSWGEDVSSSDTKETIEIDVSNSPNFLLIITDNQGFITESGARAELKKAAYPINLGLPDLQINHRDTPP